MSVKVFPDSFPGKTILVLFLKYWPDRNGTALCFRAGHPEDKPAGPCFLLNPGSSAFLFQDLHFLSVSLPLLHYEVHSISTSETKDDTHWQAGVDKPVCYQMESKNLLLKKTDKFFYFKYMRQGPFEMAKIMRDIYIDSACSHKYEKLSYTGNPFTMIEGTFCFTAFHPVAKKCLGYFRCFEFFVNAVCIKTVKNQFFTFIGITVCMFFLKESIYIWCNQTFTGSSIFHVTILLHYTLTEKAGTCAFCRYPMKDNNGQMMSHTDQVPQLPCQLQHHFSGAGLHMFYV